MYIHNVPVFALPFGVFPQQQGRRTSGYILPTWGESSFRGRYLRGLGYYWVPSDYWDYRIQFDFWESQGISIRNRLRYNKRYLYSGNINFKYDDKFFQDKPERNYDISVQHSQTIDPTMDLRIDGRFVSSQQFLQESSIEREERLQQQIRSNATLSKRWENSGNSMTLNLSRTENLQNGNISERIPQISFRRGTNKLLTAPQNAPLAVSERWYYNINYSYSANLSNEHTRELNPDSIYVDQYGIERDLGRDSVFVDEYQRGINHSLSFNSPGKILRYISITPRLSFRENWVPEYREAITRNGVVVADTIIRNPGSDNPDTTYTPHFRVVNQYRARHTYNFSINASTKLYGLFNLPFTRLPAIRHVLTPSISYNIGPDFSKEWYGYYQYARMPDGSIEKFDRFRGTAAGGTGARETQSMSISLRNLFQAKYLTGSGEDQQENTIDFLTWNLSTGYNFVAKEQPWSDIRSSMRASLGRAFALDISMTHDPYKFNSNELTVPRLTSLTMSTNFSISGNAFAFDEENEDVQSSAEAPDTTTTAFTTQDSLFQDADGNDSFSPLPSRTGPELWNLSMRFNYSMRHENPTEPVDETFWINTTANLNISENWSVSIINRFDLVQREIVSTDFRINRDLHCWQMSFTWTPSGPGQGYYLRINVKSSALQDVKVESRGGRRSRIGY